MAIMEEHSAAKEDTRAMDGAPCNAREVSEGDPEYAVAIMEDKEYLMYTSGQDRISYYYMLELTRCAQTECSEAPSPPLGAVGDSLKWTVHIGNLVAIHHPFSIEATSSTTSPWYPFTVPWSPAQVLALSYDPRQNEHRAHVRWLYRFEEIQADKQDLLKRNQKTTHPSNLFYDFNIVDEI
jgi:hypothetical protein